jgi:hypothetical protein
MCRFCKAGGVAKKDKNGVEFHIIAVEGGASRGSPAEEVPAGPAAPLAPVEVRDRVYAVLLRKLWLRDSHRKALEARGIPADKIGPLGYGSVGGGLPRITIAKEVRSAFPDLDLDGILGVPGFVAHERDGRRRLSFSSADGLAVPVRDAEGRIVALKIRRDRVAEGGSKYVSVTSNGKGGPSPGTPVHIPLGFADVIREAGICRLTEGELKSDAASHLSGLGTIGVPGVAMWGKAVEVMRAVGVHEVRVAFDADFRTNPQVRQSLEACICGLTAADRFEVSMEVWDAAPGPDGNPTPKGIDDALLAKVPIRILRGRNYCLAEIRGEQPQTAPAAAAAAAAPAAAAAAAAPAAAAAAAAPAAEQAADMPGDDEPPAPAEEEPPAPETPSDSFAAALDLGGPSAVLSDKTLIEELARLSLEDPAAYGAKVEAFREAGGSMKLIRNAIAPTVDRLRAERPAPPVDEGSPYLIDGGRICLRFSTKDGEIVKPLCNFTAAIVEEVVADDGVETKLRFVVEGKTADGRPLPRADIDAAQFGTMNWTMAAWGNAAIPNAGMGAKDHLRCALQTLSNPTRTTVYTHTGWREIGGRQVYLHAGGALGSDGPVAGINVRLPQSLARFAMPVPPEGEALRNAVRSLLRLADLSDRAEIGFVLLAVAVRPVCGSETDYSVFLVGPSGSFKSESASLAQRAYGTTMDRTHLPASWSSTANANEAIAYHGKDALVTVDDFAPVGTVADIAALHRAADRLFRGKGNAQGRGRLASDATERNTKFPRAFLLATGEDRPRGYSVRARLVEAEIDKGDITSERLAAAQADAEAGAYAEAMAGFVRWLAAPGRLDEAKQLIRDTVRDAGPAGEGDHARTPRQVTDLRAGLDVFLGFAADIGAITQDELPRFRGRADQAFAEVAERQKHSHRDADPAEAFVRLLGGALASRRCHVSRLDGSAPANADAWGWQTNPAGFYVAMGNRIGWLEDGRLLLEPVAAHAQAQEMAVRGGDSLAVSRTILLKRLNAAGLLLETEPSRETLTVRRRIAGVLHNVIVIDPGAFCPPEVGENGGDQ